MLPTTTESAVIGHPAHGKRAVLTVLFPNSSPCSPRVICEGCISAVGRFSLAFERSSNDQRQIVRLIPPPEFNHEPD
jgi:hypothetical protein